MYEFVRNDEHPLLAELTKAYFNLVDAQEQLVCAIRNRNQKRSELVTPPSEIPDDPFRRNNYDLAKAEKSKLRKQAYTSAILQERCALNATHKAMMALQWAMRNVQERIKNNKEDWDHRHDPVKQPFNGFVLDLAKHNVAGAFALYQEAIKTFNRGQIIELDRDQTGDIGGEHWHASYLMDHLPELYYREEQWPKTVEAFRLYISCAAKAADNPLGEFTVGVENVSPETVERVMKDFDKVGWNVTLSQNETDFTPSLQFKGMKPRTDNTTKQ